MFRKHIHSEDSQQYVLSDPPKATSDVRVQQLDNTSIRKTHRPTGPTEVKAMCMNPRENRESNIILKTYPFRRFTAVMQHFGFPCVHVYKKSTFNQIHHSIRYLPTQLTTTKKLPFIDSIDSSR